MKCHGTTDRAEEVKGINFSSFVCAAQHSERSPVATRCWNSKALIAGNGLGLFFPQTVSLYLLWMTIFVWVCVCERERVCVCVCCAGVFGSPVPAGPIINSADDDKLGCWGQQRERVSPLAFSFSLCHSHTHTHTYSNCTITTNRSFVEKLRSDPPHKRNGPVFLSLPKNLPSDNNTMDLVVGSY